MKIDEGVDYDHNRTLYSDGGHVRIFIVTMFILGAASLPAAAQSASPQHDDGRAELIPGHTAAMVNPQQKPRSKAGRKKAAAETAKKAPKPARPGP